MNNRFGQRFFKQVILLVAIMVLFVTAIYAADVSLSQEVYLADEPLPKIVSKLQKQNMSHNQVVEYLKNNLIKVTPEIAKEKFNITWIDNDLRNDYPTTPSSLYSLNLDEYMRADNNKKISNLPYKYPAVAICYMGPKIGYGLFAMEDIEEGRVITEYTGKHIKREDIASLKDKSYLDSDNCIDAKEEGNAARFANHLPTEEELSSYHYKIPGWLTSKDLSKLDVAVENASLQPFGTQDDMHSSLVATSLIKAFEQIGFYYSPYYGYEFSAWPYEPYLFDKNGEIIASDTYRIANKGVVFIDSFIERTYYLPPLPENEWKQYIQEKKAIGDYVIEYEHPWNKPFIINLKEWEDQINKHRSRITVPCYYVNDPYKHIQLIQKLDRYEIDKEDKIKILKAARYKGYEEAYQILNSLQITLKDSQKKEL